MEEFPEILKFVCTYLNENEIDYVIVGGVAVMYHGVRVRRTAVLCY